MARTIYVLNGPNLNLLGTREPHIYGRSSLKDVEKLCRKTADAHGFSVEFRQSNHEGVRKFLPQNKELLCWPKSKSSPDEVFELQRGA